MNSKSSLFPDTQAGLLLRLAAADDRAAWDEFVVLYRPVIYRIARRRGLQDVDAQDLVQQVLVSVATSIEQWVPRSADIRFRHWLRRVARNAIINMATRRPRDQAIGGSEVMAMLADEPQRDEELEGDLTLELRRELLARAAAMVRGDVAAETWQAFELAVIQQLPVEEVAKQLNKSVGSVYAARGRVMRRLKEAVEVIEKVGQ